MVASVTRKTEFCGFSWICRPLWSPWGRTNSEDLCNLNVCFEFLSHWCLLATLWPFQNDPWCQLNSLDCQKLYRSVFCSERINKFKVNHKFYMSNWKKSASFRPQWRGGISGHNNVRLSKVVKTPQDTPKLISNRYFGF